MTRLVTALVFVLALPAPLGAEAVSAGNPWAPDVAEPGSVEAIAAHTTDPRYVNPWVAYVPESATVPSPGDYLGHVAGAAGELSNTAKIYGYFRALDRASTRVQVEVLGTSEEGREILLIAVADEAGLRDLPRLKEATARLADPRRTDAAAAEKIIASARPIYYFNAGLHSQETGSPEMVMEMAYRLAVSEAPMIRQIREKVVVLVNPVSEPDGRDRWVDWFYRYLKGKTDFENLPELNPPYWGHYVFHDNNRDTHQEALALTKAVHRMFHDYHPTVVHDLHESIPLLHTWNGTGPYNANLDPIATSEWLEMSFHEVTALTALGMPGVWTWGFGESWGLHYLDSVASNHNSIGRGYETFGNHTAETVERTLRPSEERYVGKPVTERDWYRPWPPDRKITWSLRDNTNYMQSACLAILDYTARHAPDMLRNFHRKGYNSWRKGVGGKPYAFVIPEDQGDRRRVAEMVNLLMTHGIEVSRTPAPLKVKEGEFPEGSFVVRLDQPYRNYAVDLLAPQRFPKDSPYEPYDDVSWALPVHYGLVAKAIEDEAIRTPALSPLTSPVAPRGEVSGPGPVFLLKDTGQESLLAARSRLSRFKVEIAEKEFTAKDAHFPAGSWILPAQAGLREALESAAEGLGLDFTGLASAPEVPRHEAPVPRLALWHTWVDTEMTGWVRYVLDQEKIPYDYIRDEEIREGGLRSRWDIILYAHTYVGLKRQIHGIDTRHGPMPYTRTPEFPSHGVPDASEDITGGIGWAGMKNLERFLDEGGLMITLGNGSALPLEGGLVRYVDRSRDTVFTPGVELMARFTQPSHPLAYGYSEKTSAFRTPLPLYEVAPADRSWVVMQWGLKPPKDERDEEAEKKAEKPADDSKEPELVVSGGVKDAEEIEGRPAILDIPAGRGRVLAFNFNPIHRSLNRSDHRFLWNAILNWSALPAVTR